MWAAVSLFLFGVFVGAIVGVFILIFAVLAGSR